MDEALARQTHARRRADARFAFELEASAVELGKRLCQREPEAGAVVASAETAVDLAEGRHGARDVLGGDADAAVAHLDGNAALVALEAQRNLAARRRELDRVRQQVHEDLLELPLIGADEAGTRRYVDAEAEAGARQALAQQDGDGLQHLLHLDHILDELEPPRFDL